MALPTPETPIPPYPFVMPETGFPVPFERDEINDETIQELCGILWDRYRADPETIALSSTLQDQLSKDLLRGGTPFFIVNDDNFLVHDGLPPTILGPDQDFSAYRISRLVNRMTGTAMRLEVAGGLIKDNLNEGREAIMFLDEQRRALLICVTPPAA